MSIAFVFPGQGSQQIGMGKAPYEAFPAAREVFQEVDDALGEKLSRLIFEGEQKDLDLTENTQPALMAVSLAVARALEKEGGFKLADKAAYVAGHSLGEYSALAAVNTFGIADAARLLRLRGQAMQRAVPVGVGAMAALLGVDFDVAGEIAAKAAGAQVCATANDNAPGQVVISGHLEAIQRAMEIGKEFGMKKAVQLPVSAPFHSPLMEPAAQVMDEALEKTSMNPPAVPVICNVSVQPENDPDRIRRLLVEQVTGTVRWRESVLFMAGQGVSKLVELGAGKVLSGLAKRITPDMAGVSVGTPEDIEEVLKSL